jgi:hypothetical protein
MVTIKRARMTKIQKIAILQHAKIFVTIQSDTMSRVEKIMGRKMNREMKTMKCIVKA